MKSVVIGTGSIGFRHLSVLRNDGRAVLALPKRADRGAELRGLGFAVADSLAEAARDGVERAIVASDTRLHEADTLATLNSGMDALVEKPLTSTLAEAQRIRAAVQATDRRVFVGCTLRFSESLRHFRSWLPRIGAVHSVRIEAQSYLPDWRPTRPYRESYSARADEGGVLRDVIHEIDYAGWLFGWPGQVQATLHNLGRLDIAAEEAADLFWIAPGGASVSLRLDYISRPPRRHMTARGEHGTLEWDGIRSRVSLATATESEEFISTQARDEMVLAQDLAFLGSMEDPHLATLDDALWAVAICDAARVASVSRREEPVNPFAA
ncbi:MAG: Gfo/Idh/MocA family oxidoreductase [Chthoniobacter sp.]